MKNSIIFFGLTLLFAAFMLSCQQQESSPVSPEESLTLDKKGVKPASGEYTVDCVDDGDYTSPTVVSNYSGDVAKNNKMVNWAIGGIQIEGYDDLDGQAAMVFYKNGGKIVSFEFWIWEGGPRSQLYLTGEVELDTAFEVPPEGGYTVPLHLDNITLNKQMRGKKVEFFGTISFGDVVFTPKP